MQSELRTKDKTTTKTQLVYVLDAFPELALAPNMKCCGPKTRYTILLITGIILIVLPLTLHDYINQLIRNKIASEVEIKPGSEVYDQWKKPTVPVYLKIYTFDIVNTLEVKQGKPPAVIEKGPYSYKESREKVNISWGNNNVTYNQVTHYTFDPEASCSSCDPNKDIMTTFNIPLIAITQLLKPFKDIVDWKEVADIVLKYFIGEELFLKRSVNETIWGYEEPLFKKYDQLRTDLLESRFRIIRDLAKKLPDIPSRFALQPNPSYDGVTTVNTGQNSIDNVGEYLKWKGNKTLPFWSSTFANMLNGTDGTIFQPHISKDDKLYIFIIQLCRSVHVNYLSDSTIRGISGLRFHPPKSLFTSGNISAENRGFCNPKCLPSGLLSVKACVPFNAPIVVSSPHFLNGDPILLKEVEGLHPNEEKHDTFLHLEPNTGSPLQASKRIQFNIHVEPVDGFEMTSGITPTHVPIMWVEEHFQIDEENAEKLKKKVLDTLEIIKWVEIGLYILGGLLVLISLLLFIRLCRKKNDGSQLNLLAEDHHENYHSTNGFSPSVINATD